MGPTRAERLRAASERYKLTLTVEFGCESCRASVSLKALAHQRDLDCSACGQSSWTLRAVFRGGETGATKDLDAASLLGLAAGIATGGEVFFGGGGDDHDPGRQIRERFSEPKVSTHDLAQLLRMKRKQQRDAILTFLHGRELTRSRQIRELLQTHAVHCLACRQPFVPTVALEQHEVLGDVGQGDDTTCSNHCRRALREATQARTCPVCSRVFVPPPRPAIDRDWEQKAWHANGYCTKNCYEGRERLRTCGACREPFVIPKPNPLAKHAKKPKAWHEAGYCSKACQAHPESFQDCSVCAKRFQLASPSKLSKAKPKPWHTAGFCSKACRDDPAPAPSGPVAVPLLPAACSAGHTFEVPVTHAGLKTTCPECRVTVRVSG